MLFLGKLISSTPIQSLEFGRLSEEDTCSIFSDWNVEDNVHQLLYKDVIPKKNPVVCTYAIWLPLLTIPLIRLLMHLCFVLSR